MIKQIQLRGISRSPSDRMTSDGGCAESLNVQLDHGELTPMPQPEDVSEEVIKEDDLPQHQNPSNFTLRFIHNGTYYRNYIIWRTTALIDPRMGIYVRYELVATIGDSTDRSSVVIKYWRINGSNQPSSPSISSVGNTLVVSFNGDMWYFLFKDGAYKVLGDQIPIPKIRFYMKPDSARVEPSVSDVTADIDNCNTELVTMGRLIDYGDLDTQQWGNPGNNYKVNRDAQRGVIANIWDRINLSNTDANRQSKCLFPVFVRYAVRLYDGSLYACSIPVLVGADLAYYLAIKLISKKHGLSATLPDWWIQVVNNDGTMMASESYDVGAVVRFPAAYSIVADFTYNGVYGSDWDDIITGIDLFVSTPILPMLNADAIRLESRQASGDMDGDYYRYYTATAILDPRNSQDKQENLLLAHQTTFLAKSWKLDELTGLTEVELTDINYSGDWLSSQEMMKETYNSVHKIVGNKLDSYNGRLLLEGSKTTLYPGYPFYASTLLYQTQPDISYSFIWHLSIDGEEKTVITKNPNGGTSLSSYSAGTYYELMQGYLSYPDARAYKVDVYKHQNGNTYVRSYNAKPFTEINASYVFDAFGNTFSINTRYDDNLPAEDASIVVNDSIYMSAPSNPFIFPAGGVIDFDNANILGTAMVTKALSQGQFGQYPLCVFTSTGIWALGLNSEGDFVSKHAVSRDVALEGTIAPIDQAIVFTTKKGVMMLSGSDIASISPDMNGKHYVLDAESATLLGNNGMAGFIQASQNPETFQQFMENSIPVYDYIGERLVFCSPRYGRYMYVYRLPAGTWHKMTLLDENGDEFGFYSSVGGVNSYPEALISMQKSNVSGGSIVYNLSTVLDHSGAEGSEDSAMETGLIVTRPFDLDAPDVRKVIKDIRIRGQFNRGDVKYILLGSFDGINWKRLTSLRGGSFKLFRMVIVANLSPNERISWIDVDYDTRFTNRLR